MVAFIVDHKKAQMHGIWAITLTILLYTIYF